MIRLIRKLLGRRVLKTIVQMLDNYAPRVSLHLKLLLKHGYEPELRFIPFLCNKQSAAIDVGANWGMYTHHMTRHAETCFVFEPHPAFKDRLKKIFKDKARVETVALSDKRGVVTLKAPKGITGLATIEQSNPVGQTGELDEFQIETRVLDDYDLPRVSCIKIDVEGHEEKVLKGAIKLLKRDLPALLIEMEERHNPGVIGRIQKRLKSLGYAGYFLKQGRVNPIDEFDVSSDQREETITFDRPQEQFINNFLFIFEEGLKRRLDQRPLLDELN